MAIDQPNPEEDRRHSELRNSIDRIAETAAQKAATKTARDAVRRQVPAYFIVLLVLLVGAVIYQRTVDHRVYVALDRGCQRLNTLRVKEANQGFQSIWKAFYLARERARTLAATADDSKVRMTNTQAVKTIGELTRNLKWTPETNCSAFADDPSSYRPPQPRPFTPKFLDLDVVPK